MTKGKPRLKEPLNDARTVSLAAGLRQAWLESGLLLSEVARRSGVISDRSYLSRAFNGRQTLSPATLGAVARVLKLDYRTLLAEAGLDEQTYRSRHAERAAPVVNSVSGWRDVQAILAHTLEDVRWLKAEGEARRGAWGDRRGRADRGTAFGRLSD